MNSNNVMTHIEQPKLIKIEGKSIEMQKRKLLNNDSVNISCENYDTNNNLILKEKLKENNFLKSNKNAEDKNKHAIGNNNFKNNKINKNKFEDSSANDFLY